MDSPQSACKKISLPLPGRRLSVLLLQDQHIKVLISPRAIAPLNVTVYSKRPRTNLYAVKPSAVLFTAALLKYTRLDIVYICKLYSLVFHHAA